MITAEQFPDIQAGEWVKPVKRGYLFRCCDCGLVHRMDFRVVKEKGKQAFIQGSRYKAQFRAYRFEEDQA